MVTFDRARSEHPWEARGLGRLGRDDERTTVRFAGRIAAAALALTLGCGTPGPADPPETAAGDPPTGLDTLAESYVRLTLGLGVHDRSHVDAYYGPTEWREEAVAEELSLEDLKAAAVSLVGDLEGTDAAGAASGEEEELLLLRHQFLLAQARALVARLDMLTGDRGRFDEESRRLYDAVAPAHGPDHFEETLAKLDERLPGPGPLVSRFERFKIRYAIPDEALDTVFRRAIEACRERTLHHIELPDGESFEIEYVRGRPWAAYNFYKGNYHSLIQVNTSFPIFIDRAVDLACHEGYPGHHVYNVLLEQHLVRGKQWREFAVYPLYSPQSLMSEGSAHLGIEMAFPGDERVAFERDVLFPLAGLDPADAEPYYEIHRLIEQLGYANVEAARRYLDGDFDFFETIDWLEQYALMPSPRPAVQFINENRSYVINYYLGRDLVRRYLEARGGSPEQPDVRWAEFTRLLSTPRTPSGLQ